jgi:hypothetical protein
MPVIQSKRKHKLPELEYKLSKYKHRMELIRTAIGIVVLIFQMVIVYNLLTK